MVEINSIECNSIESIDTSNLNNQQFRLNKISKIEDYFIPDYFISFFFIILRKSLIVLPITSGGVSIASFTTVIGIPIGITSASLSLAFSLCTGLVKKLLKATRNKKKRSIIKLLC